MNRFLRWLFRPLAYWLTDEVKTSYGEYIDGGMFICFVDGFGTAWYVEKTTDQMREQAWDMIGMADNADRDAVYQE